MQVIKCNVCGKEFDEWDRQEKFGFDLWVGYGSKYDGEHLQADICCECFDQLMAQFIHNCKYSPVNTRPLPEVLANNMELYRVQVEAISNAEEK